MSILFEKQRWKIAQHYSHSVNNATVSKALSPARIAVRCNRTKAVMADLHTAVNEGLPLADESCYLYNSTTTGPLVLHRITEICLDEILYNVSANCKTPAPSEGPSAGIYKQHIFASQL